MGNWFEDNDPGKTAAAAAPAPTIPIAKKTGNWFQDNDPGNLVNASSYPVKNTIPTNIPPVQPPQGMGDIINRTPGLLEQTGLDSLPFLGTALGSMAGQPIFGAAAGSFLKQGLDPRTVDSTDALLNVGNDTLINGIVPQLGGKLAGTLGDAITSSTPFRAMLAKIAASRLFKNLPAVRGAVANSNIQDLIPQVANKVLPESGIVETAATNAQNNLPVVPHWNDPGTVGEDLMNIPYKQTEGSPYSISKLADKGLSDVSQVRNWKLATGETSTIQQLGLRNAIGKGYNEGTGEIDPDAILKELTGDKADVYKEALQPATMTRLKSLLNNIKSNQADLAPSGMDHVMQYAKHRMLFDLPFMLGAGMEGHEALGAAAIGGVILTDSAITKLMSDPVISKLTAQAIKTGTNSAAAPMLQKAITWALRGTPVMIQAGSDIKNALINQNGQLQLQAPGPSNQKSQ